MSQWNTTGIEQSAPAHNEATVLPLVLLVDVSNSMNKYDDPPEGEPQRRRLDHLVDALTRLFRELCELGDVRRGGEVAMVTFGGDGVRLHDLRPEDSREDPAPTFVRVVDATPPTRLVASGVTPLAAAIDLAVDLIQQRHTELSGHPRYRANLWVLTDGQNSDEGGYFSPLPAGPIEDLHQMEVERKVLTFCGALPGANVDELRRLAPRSTFSSQDAAFRDITKLIAMSSAAAGEAIDAPADEIYGRLEEMYGQWPG